MKDKFLYKEKISFLKDLIKNNGIIEFFNRFTVTLISIIIFRLGTFIPIPGINVKLIINNIFKDKNVSILNIFNLFSGGALSRISIFSLGVVPYISASTIVHFFCIFINYFIELKKDGELGKKKINRYICIFTLILSIFQSVILIFSILKLFTLNSIIFNSKFNILFLSILSLISGSLILIWLSNEITTKGIGNGISIIIFSGILSEIPKIIINIFKNININILDYLILIKLFIIIFLFTYLIVFIECSQRKIDIIYPRRYICKKKFSHSYETYLPIKINISGVMPTMFSQSILIILNIFLYWIKKYINISIFNNISKLISYGTMYYNILLIIFILLFCFIYTSLIFDTKETSDNLKKSGAYICGIRPGNNTSIYIKEIVDNLTFIGACYISIICVIPELIKKLMNISFLKFNGTSMLIVVVVIIDAITQIQSIIINTRYNSILKKINMKNRF